MSNALVATRQELCNLRSMTKFSEGKHKWISKWGGYCLALKRSMGHTGAQTAATMVAGDEHQGAVDAAHSVLSYECRVAGAKVVR
eukprot:8129936-Pyramimonas_sp.AAC.1